MELLLWQWSVGVQFTSLAMIAVFFLVLERSLRLGELRFWAIAWGANLLALGITFVYWNWRPTGGTFRAIAASYLGAKTVFAVLLILGALRLRRVVLPRAGRCASPLGSCSTPCAGSSSRPSRCWASSPTSP